MAAADRVYRGLLSAVGFFSKGWGPVETYQSLLRVRPRMLDRGSCSEIVADNSHPVTIKEIHSTSHSVTFDGRFISPLASFLPGLLPRESEVARFQLILPRQWRHDCRPVYIHLAGTGDHYFWRRRNLTALPLIKEAGFGSLLLENPYYGSRKPRQQTRSQLHYVSDLFVMGLSLIFECQRLLGWLEGEGLGPVGLTGISMGGHNASLAASLWPKPVSVVPCLSWCTASCVFTEGMLSGAVHWDVLEQQLLFERVGRVEQHREVFRQMLQRGCDEAARWWEGGDAHRANVSLDTLKVEGWGHLHGHSASSGGEPDRGEPDRSLAMEDRAGEDHGLEGRVPRALLQGRRLPTIPQRPAKAGQTEQSWRRGRGFRPHPETVTTLRRVLDLATHLCYFPPPLDPERATFVVASDDLYIPRHNVTDVRHLWPGCVVRYVNGGHVSSTLLKQVDFRHALTDAMNHTLMASAIQCSSPVTSG